MIDWLRNRKSERHEVEPAQVPNPLSTLPATMRIHAIGDIHGCDALLKEMYDGIDHMARTRPMARVVEVVLGDFVDRGPDTRGVIDRLIARSERHEVVVLRGNHEAMMLRFLSDPLSLRDWIKLGGLQTLLSYGVKPILPLEDENMVETAKLALDAIPEEHLNFLRGSRLAWTFGAFTFVHAGLRPGIPLAEQSERDLLEIRNTFLDFDESFGTYVIHGHTPVKDIDVRHNRINVDIGAFATGRLGSVALEKDCIFSLRTRLPNASETDAERGMPGADVPRPRQGARLSGQDRLYTAQSS